MQFTQKIDNYGLLSSCNSTSKEKKKKHFGSYLSETTRGKKQYSPPKTKMYSFKINIYIHSYSEIDSRKLFGSFGNGKEDNKSNIKH